VVLATISGIIVAIASRHFARLLLFVCVLQVPLQSTV
jgi:hypothetical protein